MANAYLAVCDWLDRAALAVCALAALVLAGAVLAIVILRYAFGVGFIELQDAAAYTFAALAILSIPVCLARNAHVRVEVVSERRTPRWRKGVDAAALLVFLVPLFGLTIWAYWPDLAYAWSIREASVETGGLPGLFLVKTVLPAAAALSILQGIAAVLRGDAA